MASRLLFRLLVGAIITLNPYKSRAESKEGHPSLPTLDER